MKTGFVLAAGVLLLAGAAPAAVDLAGTWRHQSGVIVTVTQVGDAVTIPRPVGVFGTIPLTTTITAPGDVFFSGGNLRLHPGENVIQVVWVFLSGSQWDLFTRCQCDDGNSLDGDGCDSLCRVEPCFTCSGEPSICTPTADGGACDDHSICTTGETCAAGVCGGTTVPGCIDLSGEWLVHEDGPFGPSDYPATIEQRNDLVIFRTPPSGPHWVGTLDTLSGALTLRLPPEWPCPTASELPGSATPASFTAAGTQWRETGPTGGPCLGLPITLVGTRPCGDGTIDAGETCDDGDSSSGDGCDRTCQVETCWTCAGEPSLCAPDDGTNCDDGDVCTTSDTCLAGFCAGGAPVTCDPCFACQSPAGCVATPRNDCRTAVQPERGRLLIAGRSDAAADSLKWLWPKGAATVPADFGDPTAGSDVILCVFDESAASPSLAFRAIAPAGSACGARPCWKRTASGFSYRDPSAAGDGIGSLLLKSGAAGRAKMSLKAKGTALTGRPHGLPAPPLALPLRAQLQIDGAACFETRHDATTVRRNEPGAFTAAGSP